MITANSKALEVNSFEIKSVLNAKKSFFAKLNESFNSAINYLYAEEYWVKNAGKDAE